MATMESRVRYQRLFDKLTVFFSTAIRFMLNALVLVISLAIIIGVIKAGINLFTHLSDPLEDLLQIILLDVVFIVALIEITIVILGYLKDGAVHVRYIVDTILIIMLNKVVSFWFEGGSLQEAISLSVLILTLALVRISTIKWGPDRNPSTPKPD
jgi:uncharacterized membrane protein (DUF373 family)